MICLGLATALAAVWTSPPVLAAHGRPAGDDQKGPFPTQLNLAAPSSAALDILGVAASKAKSPNNLQEIVLGAVNSFDDSGFLKSGFAYSATMASLSHPSANELFRIKNRAYYNSNWALAAVRGTGDDKSGRLAGSLSIPLLDKTDWRYDVNARKEWTKNVAGLVLDLPNEALEGVSAHAQVENWLVWLRKKETSLIAIHPTVSADIAKIQGQIASVPEKNPPDIDLHSPEGLAWTITKDTMKPYVEDKALAEVIDDEQKKVLDAIKAKYEKDHWNDQKLDVALAYAFFSADSLKDQLKGEGTYAIASYVHPLGPMQFTAYGRYASKDRQWDADTKVWTRGDSRSFGFRIRGGSENGGFFLEHLQTNQDPEAGDRRITQVWQGGYETKLGGSQWLEISLGQGSGGISKTILGLNLNFNLSPTRYLTNHGENAPAAVIVSSPSQPH